ncbi:MAG: hypothetical protein WC254_02135 [Candidatus Woesearchaeota archaeon]|jgi:hypothetical protein
MNKKIIMLLVSILSICFLSTQACTTTGLASECFGEGQIVCDGTEAYQCQLTTLSFVGAGGGYYVSKAPAFDVSECGAESREEEREEYMSTTDSDGDGVMNIDDHCEGGDDSLDIDADGIPDLCDRDMDDDGFPNLMEEAVGSDPELASSTPENLDSDGDTMIDLWEDHFGLDKNDASDASADLDGDGLTNLEEYTLGSDPSELDTDGDGLSDGTEVNLEGTDPTLRDTDGDGLSDSSEVDTTGRYITDPTLADTDADGLTDKEEIVTFGTDPTLADTDSDGLNDSEEITIGTEPTMRDTDSDSLADGPELIMGFDPLTDDLSSSSMLDFNINDAAWTPHPPVVPTYFGASPLENYAVDVTVITVSGMKYLDMSSTSADGVLMNTSFYTVNPSNWIIVKANVNPGTFSSTDVWPIVHLVKDGVCSHPPTYSLAIDNGAYAFKIALSGPSIETVTSGTTVPISGTTQSVIGAYKDGQLYLFVDNQLVGQETTVSVGPILTDAYMLLFGHNEGGCTPKDYEGILGPVQIWGG